MILRQWNRSDLVPFASINADKQVMKYFPSTLTRPASDEFARRIMTEMSEIVRSHAPALTEC